MSTIGGIPSVKEVLCRLAISDSVLAIVWCWSCGGWSALHYIQPGPPVLFDVDTGAATTGPSRRLHWPGYYMSKLHWFGVRFGAPATELTNQDRTA